MARSSGQSSGGSSHGADGYALLRVDPGEMTASGTAELDDGFGVHGVSDVPGTCSCSGDVDLTLTRAGNALMVEPVPLRSGMRVEGTVVRFNAQGAVDGRFGSLTGAHVHLPGDLSDDHLALTVLPDGAVIVVGASTKGSFVAKLHRNGSPAVSMGPNGVETLAQGEGLSDVAALPDGRIVAAGDRGLLGVRNVLYRFQGDPTIP